MSVIIGISLGYNSSEEKKLVINKSYAKVIKIAGGIPVILPPFIQENDFIQFNNIIDGILLTGGGDIDPRYFGKNPQTGLGRIDPIRDVFEIKLCRWAIERDLPVLAICRGIQVLNIACGGTINQDLSGEFIKHEQESPCWHPSHKIELKDDKLLYDIYGKRTIYVNSFHHQAVEKPGENLEVAARAPDGVIEALVSKTNSFILGVQWHPELMYRKLILHLKLFETFLENC